MTTSNNNPEDSRGEIPGVDICACHGKMCDECLDKYGIEK
jgi:hypothetical protein